MNPLNRISPARRMRLFRLLAFCAALALIGMSHPPGVAHSAQENDERKFDNTIPAHVPIRVKLKNEQTFKDMRNKNWAREFEVEVKNTGDKPIYFMYMLIVLPDVLVGGYPSALDMTYGRKELVRFNASLLPDDVPILPGESVTLKIPKEQWKGYEGFREAEKHSDPKLVRFDLQIINFGDGTGLHGTDGRANPNPARRQSSRAPCAGEKFSLKRSSRLNNVTRG